MTLAQKDVFQRILSALLKRNPEGISFRHGDCIGADAEAHQIARALGISPIIGHPPSNDSKRSFCEFDEQEEPLDYLVRNARIAKCSEILIGTPKEYTERVRSGTWSTIRKARKLKKRVIVILPDGSLHKDKEKKESHD